MSLIITEGLGYESMDSSLAGQMFDLFVDVPSDTIEVDAGEISVIIDIHDDTTTVEVL